MAKRKFRGGEQVTIKLSTWAMQRGMPVSINGGGGVIDIFDSGHYRVSLDAETARKSGRAHYWLTSRVLTAVDNLFS